MPGRGRTTPQKQEFPLCLRPCVAHGPDFPVDCVVWHRMHVRQFRRHRMQQDAVASSSLLVVTSFQGRPFERSQLRALRPCMPCTRGWRVSHRRCTALIAVGKLVTLVYTALLSSHPSSRYSITQKPGQSKACHVCGFWPIVIRTMSHNLPDTESHTHCPTGHCPNQLSYRCDPVSITALDHS